MSRTRIVKGKITERVKGDISIYSASNIIETSMQSIVEIGKEKGISFGQPKPFPKNERIEGGTVLYFEPLVEYLGEFGYDAFPNTTFLQNKLKDSLVGGRTSSMEEYINTERAFEELKKEYQAIPIEWSSYTNENEGENEFHKLYYVPYVTLFSKEFVKKMTHLPENLKPRYQMKLRLFSLVEKFKKEADESWEQIYGFRLEYNKELFELSNDYIGRLSNYGKNIIPVMLTVTCLKVFSEPQEIRAYTIPFGPDRSLPPAYPKKLAGKIIILPNDKKHRKHVNIALVRVTLDIKNKKHEGNFFETEKVKLAQVLGQALIVPNIIERYNEKDNFILDLSDVKEFQENGSYIKDGFINPKLFQDKKISVELYNRFINERVEKIFNNEPFLGVFSMGKTLYDMTEKGISEIGEKSAMIFPNRGRIDTIITHEVLHCMGLVHTFKSTDDENMKKENPEYYKNAHYLYRMGATNNIMDYYYRITFRKPTEKQISDNNYHLWYWQWKLINDKIK